MRFENFVKPHSNELIAVWELHNLRQGTLSLKEFIAKLRILVKKANYPVEQNKAKPASKCLELCDVRDNTHPFQLKKKKNLLNEYQDVFTCVGCFPGHPYHIQTNPNKVLQYNTEMKPLPGVFDMLKYFERILPLVESP